MSPLELKSTPQRIVRLVCWLIVYLVGAYICVRLMAGTEGIKSFELWRLCLLVFLVPNTIIAFALPDSWHYALFAHLPAAPWIFGLLSFSLFLLNLVLTVYVTRIWSFCVMLALLVALFYLTYIGAINFIEGFPVPD